MRIANPGTTPERYPPALSIGHFSFGMLSQAFDAREQKGRRMVRISRIAEVRGEKAWKRLRAQRWPVQRHECRR